MKALSVIGALIALAIFLAGCAGVIRPTLIHLRRRRHALAVTGFAFVVMGFAVDLNPPPDDYTGPIGVQILATWLICVIATWGVLGIVRVARPQKSASVVATQATEPFPSPPANSGQSFWTTAPVPVDETPAPAPAPAPAPVVVRPIPKPKPVLPPPARAKPAPSLGRANWAPGESGTTANFTYVDQNGIVTDRMVANWRSEGPYIRAFCLDKLESRTFRKDRIEDWRE